MKITLVDRILIPDVLKKEGNYSQMIINKDIVSKCQLSQSELEEFEVKQFGTQLSWNEKGVNANFEIEFTELEKNEIREGLKKINEENKLNINLIHIYELFVNK